MTKKKLKNLICLLLTVALLVLALSYLGNLLENKRGRNKYDTFLKIGEDVDVLYMGSSHIYNDVFPMEIWNDFGIAGYTLGHSSFRIPMNYWLLLEALKYSNPKLVVMDVFLLSEDAMAQNDAILHSFFDGFPFSFTKLKAIFDLDETLEGKTDKLSLLFNLSAYHGRWEELTDEDFENPWNYARGAFMEHGTYDGIIVDERISKDVVTEDYNVSMEYLEKICALCKDKDIPLLLLYLPQPMAKEAAPYYNWCYGLAEKYGASYVDLSKEDIVDYRTDVLDLDYADVRIQNQIDKGIFKETSVYDNNGHLNYKGADKVSAWLGEYISSNYDIPDRRSEEKYSYWHEDYEIWKQNYEE